MEASAQFNAFKTGLNQAVDVTDFATVKFLLFLRHINN